MPRNYQPPSQVNPASTMSPSMPQWLQDSGASHHVTADLNILSTLSNYTGSDDIIIGDGTGLPITHTGSITISSPSKCFLLQDVLCVPEMKKNLNSVSQFCLNNNASIEFSLTTFLVMISARGQYFCKVGLKMVFMSGRS